MRRVDNPVKKLDRLGERMGIIEVWIGQQELHQDETGIWKDRIQTNGDSGIGHEERRESGKRWSIQEQNMD